MTLPEAVALAGVLAATIIDWRQRKVPNWLTIALVCAGVAIGIYTTGLIGAMQALGGFALGLALLLYPFSMRWIGGGDVKLLAGVGAIVGCPAVLWVFLYGAIAGGIGALALVVYRSLRAGELLAQLRVACIAFVMTLMQLPLRAKYQGPSALLPATKGALREKFPYAFAIAAGTIVVLWQGI